MPRGPLDRTHAGPLSGPAGARARITLGPGEKVETIGAYRVRGTLGRGGMGIVYEVQHGETSVVYALKTIEARFLALPENNAGGRFNQEIRVLAKLDHPGVVRLHDYGLANHPLGYDVAYFVMERLEGVSLDGRLADGDLFEPADVVRAALEITDALAYLEDHGVLHRDIKPANLFQTREGRLVLMDFGLARSAEFTRLTRAGHVIGTLPYISPEALRAEPTDSTADVYALGAVLFELLTGRHPFEGQDPSQLVQIIERGLVWPEDVLFEGHELRVRDLVADMLHPEPTVRPSPKEVAIRAGALRRSFEPAASVRAPVASTPVAPTPAPPPRPPAPATESLVHAAPARRPEAASGPRSAPATPPIVVSEAESPLRPLPRPGPTWPVAGAMIFAAAAVTFVAGLFIGQRTAPRPTPGLVAAPAKPPPAPARRAPAPPPAQPAPPPAPKPQAELPDFEDAEAAFAWGDRALREGRQREAIEAFERTLALNPALARAHRRLGDAYLSLGELDEAVGAYKTYRALRPTADDADQVKELIRKVGR